MINVRPINNGIVPIEESSDSVRVTAVEATVVSVVAPVFVSGGFVPAVFDPGALVASIEMVAGGVPADGATLSGCGNPVTSDERSGLAVEVLTGARCSGLSGATGDLTLSDGNTGSLSFSVRACGVCHSARASAVERASALLLVGEGSGAARRAEADVGAREDVLPSSPRYQQWRLVPDSMR
jgi:hypothetical protein